MIFILDFLIIVIVVLTVYAGFKNGFIKTVAGLFGGIISFFAARGIAGILSPALAEIMPVPTLGDAVAAKVNAVLLESDTAISVGALLEGIGLPAGLVGNLQEETGSALAGAAASAANRVAAALVELLSWCIVFIIAFILCALLIRLLCVWLNIFAKFPIIRTLNSLLGALSGLFAGLFLAWLFAIVFAWIGPTVAVSAGLDISGLDYSRTFFFQYFSAFNPLKLLF